MQDSNPISLFRLDECFIEMLYSLKSETMLAVQLNLELHGPWFGATVTVVPVLDIQYVTNILGSIHRIIETSNDTDIGGKVPMQRWHTVLFIQVDSNTNYKPRFPS